MIVALMKESKHKTNMYVFKNMRQHISCKETNQLKRRYKQKKSNGKD